MEGTDLAWRAEAVGEADLEGLYKDTESFRARELRHRKTFSITGWIIAAFEAPVILTLSVAIVVLLISHQPEPPRFIEVDTSTGWIGEATAARDAPKLFNERTAMHYLTQYIEARESYQYEIDNKRWRIVKAMSSREVFSAYEAWRKSDLSPVKQFNTSGGRADVFNYTPDLHPTKADDGSLTYVIRFQRREVKQSNIGQLQAWQAQVTFQWHPELTVSAEDSIINPGNMVVVGYSAREQ